MSNVYKVIDSVNNEAFNDSICTRLQNALVLKYSNPCVSLSFLKDDISLEEGIKLGEMSQIKFTKDECYDKNDIFIDNNIILTTIVNELCMCAKKSLEKENNNDFYLANIVKEILESKVLTKANGSKCENITVDDLMAKLYGEEEKGMVKWLGKL